MSETDLLIDLREGAFKDLIRRDGYSSLRAWCEDKSFSLDTLQSLLSGRRPCSWATLLRLSALLNVEPTTIADVHAKPVAA